MLSKEQTEPVSSQQYNDTHPNEGTTRSVSQNIKLNIPKELLINTSSTKLDKDTLFETFLLFQNFLQNSQRNEFLTDNNTSSQSPQKQPKLCKTNENEKKSTNYDDIPAIGHNKNFIDLVEKTLAKDQNYNQNVCCNNDNAFKNNHEKRSHSKNGTHLEKLSSSNDKSTTNNKKDIFDNKRVLTHQKKNNREISNDYNKPNINTNKKKIIKAISTNNFDKQDFKLSSNYGLISKQTNKRKKLFSNTDRTKELKSKTKISFTNKSNIDTKNISKSNFSNYIENQVSDDTINKSKDFKISSKLYNSLKEQIEEETPQKQTLHLEPKYKNKLAKSLVISNKCGYDINENDNIEENIENEEDIIVPKNEFENSDIKVDKEKSNLKENNKNIKENIDEEMLNLHKLTNKEKRKIILEKEKQLDTLKKDYERLNKQLTDGIDQYNQAKEKFLNWKENEIKQINKEKKDLEKAKSTFNAEVLSHENVIKNSKIQNEKINSLTKQISTLKKEFAAKEKFYKNTIEELKSLLNDYSNSILETKINSITKKNIEQSQSLFDKKNKKNNNKFFKSKTINKINSINSNTNSSNSNIFITNTHGNTSNNSNNNITLKNISISKPLFTPINNTNNVLSKNKTSEKSPIKLSKTTTKKENKNIIEKPIIKDKSEYDLEFNNKYQNDKSICTKEETTNDKKIIKFFDDGHKQIVFPSGVKKDIFSDGYQIVFFPNGDIKQILIDGRTKYYFKEKETIQTTYKDGLIAYKFSNQQIERHYPNGKKEVFWENGIIKVINPDGTEKTFYPNNDNTNTFFDINEEEPVQQNLNGDLNDLSKYVDSICKEYNNSIN